MKKIVVVALVVVSTFSITACGANDTDIGGRISPTNQIINMPNHFSSVVTACYGQFRVFETDHGDSPNGGGGLQVVADPEGCK